MNDEATEKAFVANAPMGRWGEVGEIADVIAFLAGGASSYMTGQTLVIDGGLSLGAM
ncbi:hypothetical protein BH23ACT9_BH23ACT9_04520 [soil metagenome]